MLLLLGRNEQNLAPERPITYQTGHRCCSCSISSLLPYLLSSPSGLFLSPSISGCLWLWLTLSLGSERIRRCDTSSLSSVCCSASLPVCEGAAVGPPGSLGGSPPPPGRPRSVGEGCFFATLDTSKSSNQPLRLCHRPISLLLFLLILAHSETISALSLRRRRGTRTHAHSFCPHVHAF